MKKLLAIIALVTFASAAAPAPSPIEAAWRTSIDDANKAWAKVPHAILKIQDAAYLGEGQSATLVGAPGKPDSYKWVSGIKPDARFAALFASFKDGKLSVMGPDKPLFNAMSNPMSDIRIEENIDVQAYPTQVSAGVMGVRIMLYNQKRADALNFRGVVYFPYDPDYRIRASFRPDPKLPPRIFRTSRGTDKQFFHAGDASFTLKGKRFTLPFYTGDSDPAKIKDMSAFFVDDLAGKVTYGAGRYIDLAGFGPFPPKTVTIDFNDAYNPNCSRSAFFTCPVATDSLSLAVEAGEKDPHHVR